MVKVVKAYTQPSCGLRMTKPETRRAVAKSRDSIKQNGYNGSKASDQDHTRFSSGEREGLTV